MEIDKDKVVEIVKDFYNLKINSKFVSVKECDDFWRDIEQALNPTPPRPSKEECIEWLGSYLIGAVTEESAQKINATIEYLKEPSLQWVKNTGVKPEYKKIVVFFRNGEVDIRNLDNLSLRWDLRNIECDILQYIILE